MKLIVISLFVGFCCSFYIDDNQRQFVKSFYGDNFTVDETYPDVLSCRVYTNLQLKAEQVPHNNETIYPSNLWLALIHTMPSKISHMIQTRNTWCNNQLQERYGFKCIFIFVESTVIEENKWDELIQMNQTFHDIYFIQLPDLHEHWFTLQQKNIASYIMAKEIFPDYHFYSRVDDEIVVTVDLLADVLVHHLSNPTVIGQLHRHRPYRDPEHKYYDPLAKNIPHYYLFPSGYLSLFSNDIITFIAQWKHYYTFAPSALEDPGFGHWIYKFAKETNQRVDMIYPSNWGGHMKSEYGDYIVYHDQEGHLNQLELFHRRIEDGYMFPINSNLI